LTASGALGLEAEMRMAEKSALRPARLGGCVTLFCCAWLATLPGAARGDETRVAVAANFAATAREIGRRFEEATGHTAVFVVGSTGQLYTQISQGAPFDVFLAADQERPEKAVDKGLAVPGSRFTYATGKLVLFSEDPSLVEGESTLRAGRFRKIAIADPVTAPYGAAAVQVMMALGVYAPLRAKIVQGTSIAQAYQFVATGNAELGFVALSQLAGNDAGSRWLIPEDLYDVIAQDAVLLKRASDNAAAVAFLAFLKGSEARAIEKKYGYGTAE
jgi:molybdate transport system substrate-binding protein